MPFHLGAPCGQNLTFASFVECGETFARLRAGGAGVGNVPVREETWEAMVGLAEAVVDPVWARFGPVVLTYGFASPALTRHVKGRIAPSLDQHAGYEQSAKGRAVCARGGQACDLRVEGVSSLVVAAFLRATTDFDRIYLYGPERPVHVSVGPESSRKVYAMVPGGRGLVPREVSRESLEGWTSRW